MLLPTVRACIPPALLCDVSSRLIVDRGGVCHVVNRSTWYKRVICSYCFRRTGKKGRDNSQPNTLPAEWMSSEGSDNGGTCAPTWSVGQQNVISYTDLHLPTADMPFSDAVSTSEMLEAVSQMIRDVDFAAPHVSFSRSSVRQPGHVRSCVTSDRALQTLGKRPSLTAIVGVCVHSVL